MLFFTGCGHSVHLECPYSLKVGETTTIRATSADEVVDIWVHTVFAKPDLTPISPEEAGYAGSGSFLDDEPKPNRGSGANSDTVWTARFRASRVGKVLIYAVTDYISDVTGEHADSRADCVIDIVE